MDNYELFKLQFIEKVKQLYSEMTVEQLDDIVAALNEVALGYEIKEKTTDIICIDTNGIPQVVQLFLTALAIEDKSQGTLREYKMHVMHMLQSIPKPFDKITTNDLRVYLYNYKHTCNISNSTLEHTRIIINVFYNWCKNNNLVTVNPCELINPIKVPKTKREPLDSMELELIREACENIREKALVDFLYSTGCRVEETSMMKLSDIDWKSHCAEVRHGKGDKSRTVYFNPECELSLKKYLKERTNKTEYVFSPTRKINTPYLSKRSIEKIISKIASRVQLESGKHITPHIFRHTTATIALNNGMPVEQVQKMLGHEHLDTIMIYAKVNNSQIQDSHKKYVT